MTQQQTRQRLLMQLPPPRPAATAATPQSRDRRRLSSTPPVNAPAGIDRPYTNRLGTKEPPSESLLIWQSGGRKHKQGTLEAGTTGCQPTTQCRWPARENRVGLSLCSPGKVGHRAPCRKQSCPTHPYRNYPPPRRLRDLESPVCAARAHPGICGWAVATDCISIRTDD
uniref:Uncharacterized protein n=1 Tax=Knipowitschia caucasica TaxID=637954 RepID=A0AAV2M675_KNICA